MGRRPTTKVSAVHERVKKILCSFLIISFLVAPDILTSCLARYLEQHPPIPKGTLLCMITAISPYRPGPLGNANLSSTPEPHGSEARQRNPGEQSPNHAISRHRFIGALCPRSDLSYPSFGLGSADYPFEGVVLKLTPIAGRQRESEPSKGQSDIPQTVVIGDPPPLLVRYLTLVPINPSRPLSNPLRGALLRTPHLTTPQKFFFGLIASCANDTTLLFS